MILPLPSDIIYKDFKMMCYSSELQYNFVIGFNQIRFQINKNK